MRNLIFITLQNIETRKKFQILALIFALLAALFFYQRTLYSADASTSWPADSNWNILTIGGGVIADYEARAGCVDSTNGGTSPSGGTDLGSEAKCSGGGTKYNPGNNGQPGWTPLTVYTAGNYYKDSNGDSNGCTNIADDYVMWRTRLADTPLQAGDFTNQYWWIVLDYNNDNVTDFYLRMDGSGNISTEKMELIYETNGNNDPTGEPVVWTQTGPLNSGNARVVATGITAIGDADEYYMDFQVPTTAFKDNVGTQKVCAGSNIRANHNTSQNVNNPAQKDFYAPLGSYADAVVFAPPDYTVIKSSQDLNGGQLNTGDTLEYTVTLTNLSSNISYINLNDTLPAGSIFATNGYGTGSGIQVTFQSSTNGVINTYNLTNASDTETVACATTTHCAANITGNVINFTNDWLYAKGGTATLYDIIKIKFKVSFNITGNYPNSSTVTSTQISAGITSNTVTSTVVSYPDLSTSTKTENDADNQVTSGQAITYTLTLANTGVVTATGVNLTDNVDTNLTIPTNFVFSNCGSYTNVSSGSNISITNLRIAVGTNCVITYDTTIKNPTPNNTLINNSYSLSIPTEGGSATGPISASTLTVSGGLPNLTTSTKTENDADNIVKPGDTVTYTVNLINSGFATANGVSLTDTINSNFNSPSNFTFTNCGSSYTNSSGANVSITGLQVTTSSNCVVTYNVTVKSSALEGTSINNSVNIGAPSEGGSPTGPINASTLTVDLTPNLSTSTKTENDADNKIIPGQLLTYTITLINTGDGTGSGINLTDTIDSSLENLGNLTFSNCGGSYINNSNSTSLNITGLTVTTSSNCVITYTANAKNSLSEGTLINNSAVISSAIEGGTGSSPVSSALTVDITPNLSVNKVENDADNFVSNNQIITYTVTISNTGDGLATGVSGVDAIDTDFGSPTNITFSNCGSPTNNFTDPTLSFSNLNIAVGTNCVISYDLTVDNNASGGSTLSNSFNLSSPSEGGNDPLPVTADILTVQSLPDLSTSSKTENDADNIVTPGQVITYTINLVNTGSVKATGVDITDSINSNLSAPSNLTFSNCGSSYSNNSGANIDVQNLEISNGINCVITYDTTVKNPLNEGTVISNTANISTADEGGVQGGTKNSSELTVDATPNLSATKVEDDADNIVDRSQPVIYTITISNSGDGLATGVSVVDTIDNLYGTPTDFTFTNCGSSYTNSSGANINVTGLQINTTQNCVISYKVVVDSDATRGASINNSVDVGQASEGGNNPAPVSSSTLNVSQSVDLSTSYKTDSDADNIVEPGQTVKYTIHIPNTGGVNATGVDVTDIINPNFTTPSNYIFTNCGSNYINDSGAVVDIKDLEIVASTTCTISYDVEVKSPLNEGNILANSVVVGEANEGGLGAGPVSADNLTVDATPNIVVTKSENDDDNFVLNGQSVQYTINLSNNGNGDASGISAIDVIDSDFGSPSNFSYTNCGSPNNSFSSPNLSFSNISVNVGTDCIITYDVEVDINAVGGHSIDNSFNAGIASQGGIDPSPVSASTLTVQTLPDLSTSSKSDNDTDNVVTPGQLITYSINLVNTGTIKATGVDILDTIDSNLSSPSNFTFTNCGTNYANNSGSNIDIQNLEVTNGTNCVITYDTTVKSPLNEDTVISNDVNIGTANEGGTAGGTKSASNLTVDATPNLIASINENDPDNLAEPGNTIQYTLSIQNTGNGKATQVNLASSIDNDYGDPTDIVYTNCGSSYSDVFNSPNLNISNLEIGSGQTCTITYDVTVDGGAIGGSTLINSLNVGPAHEGGNNPDLISADTITVEGTPNLTTSSKNSNDVDNIVTPGQTITYTVSIPNTGSENATGVNLTDTISSNLSSPSTFVVNNCGGSYVNSSASNVSITGLAINIGQTCTVSYDVVVNSPLNEGTVISNSALISAPIEGGVGYGPISAHDLTVNATPNIVVTKSENDDDNFVLNGQTVIYTINISNTGNGLATSVNATDIIDSDFGSPNNITYSNCGTPGSNFVEPTLSFSNLNIAVGTNCIVTYELKVNTNAIGGHTISNSINLSRASEGGNDPVSVSASDLTIQTLPDLSSSTKTEDDVDNIVVPGQLVTYTINLLNNGTIKATGVDITDSIDNNLSNPTNFTFANCGSSYTNNSGTNIDIQNLEIANGTNCVISYDTTIKNPLNEGTVISNSVNIGTANEGGVGGGNKNSTNLTVDATPNLSVTKTDNKSDNKVRPGDTIVYSIDILNSGNGAATLISAADTIDSDLESPFGFSYTNCGLAAENYVSPVLSINNISINAGSTCHMEYSVKVKSNASAGNTITNSVDISSSNEGGNNPDVVNSDTLTVLDSPNLSTSTKTDNDIDNIVHPDETLTYTLTIKNTGGIKATGVNIIDNLDPNLSAPSNFIINNCGSSYSNESVNTVDIKNLEVNVGSDCVIIYSVSTHYPINEGTTINNSAVISSSNEGGPGATINADALTVDSTPNVSSSSKHEDDVDNVIAPGDTVKYTITIPNTGDGMASGVDISDTIDSSFENPNNFTFVNCGASYINNSNSTNVSITDLKILAGESCIVSYEVKVKNGVSEGATISNTANISAPNEGGNEVNVSSNVLSVNVTPNLGIEITDNDIDNYINRSQKISFTINVSNNGNGKANGVNLLSVSNSNINNFENFIFNSCGSAYTNNSASILDIKDLSISTTSNCEIKFDAQVIDSPTDHSFRLGFDLSEALEGGNNLDVINSDTFTINDKPLPVNDHAVIDRGNVLNIDVNVLSNDSDPDNNLSPSTVSIITPPVNGSVSVNPANGIITYTPASEVYDQETIVYQICDSFGLCNSANLVIDQTNVFDPPYVNKIVSQTGQVELEWGMVWINSGNVTALNVVIVDPIPANTTYKPASVLCDARGSSVTTVCTYDTVENRIRWEGTIGPDPGGTTAANSNNEVVITFRTTINSNTVNSVENQAQGYWDQDGNGNVNDNILGGQLPVLSDDGSTSNPTDPTNWTKNISNKSYGSISFDEVPPTLTPTLTVTKPMSSTINSLAKTGFNILPVVGFGFMLLFGNFYLNRDAFKFDPEKNQPKHIRFQKAKKVILEG